MKTIASGTLVLWFYAALGYRQFNMDGGCEFFISKHEDNMLNTIAKRVSKPCQIQYWIGDKYLETHTALNRLDASIIIRKLKNTNRYKMGTFKVKDV